MRLRCYFTQTEHEPQIWGADGCDWALQMRRQVIRADHPQYEMTDDPERAELIVFWEPHQDSQITWVPRLRAHPLVRRFPNKVFVVSVEDAPLGFLSGLYTSLVPRQRHPQRHRTWVYYRTENPYVYSERDTRIARPPKWLASFTGADSDWVRSNLFRLKDELIRWRIAVRQTKRGRFARNPHDPQLKDAQFAFLDAILGSKFSLCPRGNGAGNYRLQESMALGRAPVIISDEWVPVSDIDWTRFAIFVKERNLRTLPGVLREYEPRWEEMGRRARETYDAYFHRDVFAVSALDQIVAIQRNRSHDDKTFIAQWHRIIRNEECRSGEKCRGSNESPVE